MSDPQRVTAPWLQLGINMASLAFGALVIGMAGMAGLWKALLLGGGVLGTTGVAVTVWQLIVKHAREDDAAWKAYMREIKAGRS